MAESDPGVIDWKACDAPGLPPTRGVFVRVEPLCPAQDATGLFAAIGGEQNDELWRYIPFGPPESADALMSILSLMAEAQDWQTLVFRGSDSGECLGMASYMRIRREAGSAEVGCVVFSKALQRTPAATEAMYLMMKRAFEAGYRRYEWKCDALNARSRSAAQRLGLSYEGVFRQATIYKGRNRDTAWYAAIDREWPELESAFVRWLDVSNFDGEGKQRQRLADLTRPVLKACG